MPRIKFLITIEVETAELNTTQLIQMAIDGFWKKCEGTDAVITGADCKQFPLEG